MKEVLTNLIIGLVFSNSSYRVFFQGAQVYINLHYYIMSLCVYHLSEYLYVVMYHYENVSWDSTFIIIIQVFYSIRVKSGWWLKQLVLLSSFQKSGLLALLIFIIGQLKQGFLLCFLVSFSEWLLCILEVVTLTIKSRLKKEMNMSQSLMGYIGKMSLIVKRVSRHPSYFGFFYWSVGSQILLCNPICLVGFTVSLWRFFNQRIK